MYPREPLDQRILSQPRRDVHQAEMENTRSVANGLKRKFRKRASSRNIREVMKGVLRSDGQTNARTKQI